MMAYIKALNSSWLFSSSSTRSSHVPYRRCDGWRRAVCLFVCLPDVEVGDGLRWLMRSYIGEIFSNSATMKRHVGAGLFSSLLSVVHQRVSCGALCTQSSRFAWMSVLRLSSYLLLQMLVSVAIHLLCLLSGELKVTIRASTDRC